MLVLTRKCGEAINIDGDIKVVVLKITGKQVRLGVQAPGHTVVHREEIAERIAAEKGDRE